MQLWVRSQPDCDNMDRHELAILKAKAKAYDCLEAWQPFHFCEEKEFVGLKDPAKFARRIALVYRLEERYNHDRFEN